jgi:hypothetical protein
VAAFYLQRAVRGARFDLIPGAHGSLMLPQPDGRNANTGDRPEPATPAKALTSAPHVPPTASPRPPADAHVLAIRLAVRHVPARAEAAQPAGQTGRETLYRARELASARSCTTEPTPAY